MQINKFSIEAILPDNGIRTLVDRGIKITFDTQEPTEEQFKEIFRMKGKHGKLVFAAMEYELKPEDLEVPDARPKDGKTSSQKMRSIIWAIWNSKGQQGDFDLYYETKMHSLCELLKAQIDQ